MTLSEQIILNGSAVAALEKERDTLAQQNANQKTIIDGLNLENAKLRAQINGQPSTRTPVKLAGAFIGKTILIENKDIDANGLARVIEASDGQSVIVRKCKIGNAGYSVIEASGIDGSNYLFEDCEFEQTKGYTLYLQGASAAVFRRCKLNSSTDQTPIRTMEGVTLLIEDSTVYDNVDLNSGKANQGLRIHGDSALLKDSTIGKWCKIGQEVRINPTEAQYTQKVIAIGCTFDGGIRLEAIKELHLENCTLDGTKGQSGWALAREWRDASGKQLIAPKVTAINCKFVGLLEKIVEKFGTFTNCTHNGKAI